MKEVRLSCFTLVALIIMFLNHANSESQLLHDQEHQVLMRIKHYLQDPSFLSHWTPSNSSHCSWPEISCTNGSVTGITLVNLNINQTVPSFICDLKNLTLVDFSNNSIPGVFPNYLYNCSKLEYLNLSMNYYVGEIPHDIDTLSSLKYLNLSYSNFTGDIPSSVGNLKELRFLALQDCLFNGTLPDEIGNLSNLETLDLSSNELLPPSRFSLSWTKLNKLKVFYMFECNLFDEIPERIGEMVALEKLDLSQNDLTGEIPSSLFLLKNLSVVYLWGNKLSGEIPSKIEASNLTNISLSKNMLTGKIPEDFGKLQMLMEFKLNMNNLSGEIPQSIGSLPSLVDFRVFMNNLSGTLPPQFGRNSKLQSFQISSNNFIGMLPENLCYYGELLTLTVYENSLNGELPESLGNCSTLQNLKIWSNEFSGNIPSGLWKSPNLVNFIAHHNRFTGEIPDELSPSISLFDISYNQFSGRIPPGVSSWTNVVEFIASKNYLNGTIPHELTELPKLTKLLLDQNNLTGTIPSDIASWNSLVTLNLRHNHLYGQIPDSIDPLPALLELDLSENQFSGHVPSLSSRLTNLNLSSNHLTGKVPSEFQNSAFDTSFLDNPGLCADTPVLNITLCNSGSQNSSKDSSSWSLALIIGLVLAVSLLAIVVLFLVIRFIRKRKKVDNSWKLTSFQRLSFTESDIVSSMTEHNIIGSGGYGTVYRVNVNGFGFVAVKKISGNRKPDRKLENSFLSEVKILSSIRHRNIVKLLCCIHNDDSMLLVYEYMEHRSLDKWLHKKIKPSSLSISGSVQHHHVALNWPKRIQIAIGVAQGLSYMHHDCSPPIVHRDVKTSNILLDYQFNAKVADFGLARMLIKPGELATMSTVVGSFGYLAPEYIQTTKVSEKIDVFSFGVILLELTTGKEANYGDEHSSLAEWAWKHIQLGSNIEELLDKEVMEPIYMDEMCHVFKLGVMCTSKLPDSRPTMKEALQVLLQSGESYSFGERNSVGQCDAVPLLRNSKREHKLDIDGDKLA
ncbi:hypothetical protein HN51_008565 [Arachis hypogaea]|uniref:uncharacterized protein n=1 Tax=Arachis hypogaea TaxID=3818 RepID=UPI000DED2F92|nr:receptor-like protein kinase HSL1 [Arachis hypogaea]QHO42888.1 Receptor-like protein kinase [Arachis hypogaea]